MAIEVFNRYEKKYMITRQQYDSIIAAMKNHMVLDRYNENGESYKICNIYYDTWDDRLISASIEKPVYKEKLRVTFDTNITTRRKDVRLEDGSFGEQLLPADTCLMEIKVSGAVPMWFAKIISGLNIYPASFSKYGTEYKKYMSAGNTGRTIKERKEQELCLNQYLQLQQQIMPSA